VPHLSALFCARNSTASGPDLIESAAHLFQTEDVTSARVVMFVCADAAHRELYEPCLGSFGLLSVWVGSLDDARRRLAQYRVDVLILCRPADPRGTSCEDLAIAGTTPVLVLASGVNGGPVDVLESGCAGLIAGSCPPHALAALLERTIGGERGIVWPRDSADSVAGCGHCAGPSVG
jgi:hypothetical protein